MKILLTFRLAGAALAGRIAADPALARAMGAKPNAAVGFVFPKALDAAGPMLPRLLDLCADEHISFLREVRCTAAELDAASHLEVVCRSTIAQTPPDRREMLAAYNAEPLQAGPGPRPVRLAAKAFLSKPVPALALCHIDQWTGEYAAGDGAARALDAGGFSGIEWLPLFHGASGKPQPAGRHLSTRQLLPAARGEYSQGLLSYAKGALDGSTDFARPSEPLTNWGTPSWVVRQPVRGCVVQAGIQGWAFRPVLVEGSADHEQHARLWQATLRLLAGHGRAEIAT